MHPWQKKALERAENSPNFAELIQVANVVKFRSIARPLASAQNWERYYNGPGSSPLPSPISGVCVGPSNLISHFPPFASAVVGGGFDWSLTILNAQEADEGTYECQVREKNRRKMTKKRNWRGGGEIVIGENSY